MNILVLTSSFPRFEGDVWGPWILNYCQELSKQGENVVVLTPHTPNIPKYSEYGSIKVHRFSYWFYSEHLLAKPPGIIPNYKENKIKKIQIFPYLLFNFFSALNLVKKYKIDIIHCQWTIPSGFIGLLLKIITKRSVAISAQGAEFYLPKKRLLAKTSSFVMKKIDLLMPVSLHMKKLALNYSKAIKWVEVLPNSVDTEKFKPLEMKKPPYSEINFDLFRILTVRRLVPEKRVDILIKSFAEVIKKKPECQLIIAGDGPEKKKLIKLASELEISDNIVFLGFVRNDKMNELYNSASVYVLTSEQEGLSLSLLEALATGIPVVSTNLGGNPEVIIHNKTGFLFQSGAINNLGKLLIYIIEHPEEAKRIGNKARENIISKYNTALNIKKMRGLFRQVLSNNKKYR